MANPFFRFHHRFASAIGVFTLALASSSFAIETVNSALAFHFIGLGHGRATPAASGYSSRFTLEPAFFTMSDVSQTHFGSLELDFTSLGLWNWSFGNWVDQEARTGRDHAWLTLNKGLFLLHQGMGGIFDAGLGFDFDWRRLSVTSTPQNKGLQKVDILGGGVVMRLKLDLGRWIRLSPAVTYDAYLLPDGHAQIIEGQGLRIEGDTWLRAWYGRYTLNLQPFWHWHSLDIRRGGVNLQKAETETMGLKIGFGILP